ncbi:hypothetical protein TSUD_321470 [Trifolium subterraneum]|uniref:Uncharacterized protein n=1 Tax=Trifolium subterraneum TaxID=3900 RepID=A0A2Z6N5E0_TRISU|nr:hypothetical protein TSUD_321470 [Trifolium subterraneum]
MNLDSESHHHQQEVEEESKDNKIRIGVVDVPPQSKKRKVNGSLSSHLATGKWTLSREQGNMCLRRGFGYHDDVQPVVRAFVCDNGHVSGAWTDVPIFCKWLCTYAKLTHVRLGSFRAMSKLIDVDSDENSDDVDVVPDSQPLSFLKDIIMTPSPC